MTTYAPSPYWGYEDGQRVSTGYGGTQAGLFQNDPWDKGYNNNYNYLDIYDPNTGALYNQQGNWSSGGANNWANTGGNAGYSGWPQQNTTLLAIPTQRET